MKIMVLKTAAIVARNLAKLVPSSMHFFASIWSPLTTISGNC